MKCWLGREGGGSYVTEIWDGIPEVPGRILGTSEPYMCVWARERLRHRWWERRHLSPIKKEGLIPRLHQRDTVCSNAPESWCKHFFSWLIIPSPQSPSPFCFHRQANHSLPKLVSWCGKGGGGAAWYAFCRGVIWQMHPPGWLHSVEHTLGKKASQEGGGNVIYKSNTCPNNWVSGDLCLCY